jgi:hypothetical protein
MVQMILYPLKLIVSIKKKKVEKSFIFDDNNRRQKKKIFNIINETSNMKGSSTLDLKSLPYSFNLRIYLK